MLLLVGTSPIYVIKPGITILEWSGASHSVLSKVSLGEGYISTSFSVRKYAFLQYYYLPYSI